MPNYKLIYANGRGKAETSRMLFNLAGQEFEDVRQEKEEWLKLKPNTPYGERPILMFDGVTLAQSRAIERLLAKRFNLYGTTDVEQARTDMLIDCLSDLENILFAIYRGDNKEEAKKKFLEEKGPTSFNFIEKMLSDGGFFLGDKISWADVALLNNMHYFDMVEVDMTAILDQVPKIKTLLENVKKHPTIAEWISKRAVTQF